MKTVFSIQLQCCMIAFTHHKKEAIIHLNSLKVWVAIFLQLQRQPTAQRPWHQGIAYTLQQNRCPLIKLLKQSLKWLKYNWNGSCNWNAVAMCVLDDSCCFAVSVVVCSSHRHIITYYMPMVAAIPLVFTPILQCTAFPNTARAHCKTAQGCIVRHNAV